MKIPLVVIAGRPNVGKSTLFNRLTKSGSSIVDNLSGVTRDRIYGDVEWNGKTFKVMDTGGYVPDSDEIFEVAIREQVEMSLEEADAVIFVVDGRVGLTPFDEEIANMFRLSNKPTFVLVNKLDTIDFAPNASEFWSLGIERVYDISALNGRNLGDALDELVEELKIDEQEKVEDTRLKISLVGKPNVGKSSLTNALLGYDRSIVTNIPGTTRDSVNSVLKYYGEEIVMIDTAGLRKKARVHENLEFYSNVRTYRALAESDVAIVMIDAQAGLEKQDQRIIEEAVRRRKGLIIAVNKWDLIEKETNTARDFENELLENLGSVNYAQIIFISALTKQRIFKLIDIAKEIQKRRIQKLTTNELNDVLLPEIQKTPPPTTKTGKEIKIKFINQVGSAYPVFLFFCNYPKYIPDSYKRFLENLIRKKFDFRGVPFTVSLKEK